MPNQVRIIISLLGELHIFYEARFALFKGSVTSNDSGLGFYDYNNHVAADHHLNVTAALHRRVAPRPPPPMLPSSSSSSRSQRE